MYFFQRAKIYFYLIQDYVEKTLMPQHYQEEKRKSQLRRSNSKNVSECEPSPSTSSEIIEDKKGLSSQSPSSNDDGDIQKEQQELDEEESEDFNENYEYDLVGVTVHTGTADGGHYYSFIKERNENSNGQDRWFLFNDAEVKIFDPSQIAAECFGGEMTVSEQVLYPSSTNSFTTILKYTSCGGPIKIVFPFSELTS